MRSHITQAILKSVLYADIFDYALSAQQLLPKLQLNSYSNLQPTVYDVYQLVTQESVEELAIINDRIVLKSKQNNALISAKNHHIAEEKQIHTNTMLSYIRLIPTIKFIGITGSVAASNAKENDDIDFMIITSPGKLWTTRFQVIALTHMLGHRRTPTDTQVKNKWCFNLFLDSSALMVPSHKQNLYIAHEISQMIPVLNKDNTYQKFLQANRWTHDFLPNSNFSSTTFSQYQVQLPKKTMTEFLLRNIQYIYMKRRQTTELVDNYRAFFYPRDYQKTVLTQFDNRLKQYNLYS